MLMQIIRKIAGCYSPSKLDRELHEKALAGMLEGMAKASHDHAPISNKAIRITINNDGTTKTEHYIDDTPNQEYDYCAFYMGNDRYGHFGGWGWLAVADLTEYDDDYRNAVNDLDAGDFDASQAADVIREGIKKGDLLIAKSHNPVEAMRLVCEKIDAK